MTRFEPHHDLVVVCQMDVIAHAAGVEMGPIARPSGRLTPAPTSSRRRVLDRRWLLPRDYLADPARFGRDLTVRPVLPPDGDWVSMQVALVQHRLVFAIRSRPDRRSAATVTKTFKFSKQFWSKCGLGDAWMGETVLAAAVTVLLDAGHIH